MLDSLPADLPVIYVFLMPLKSMLDMEGYWKKAAAVVLGHTDESVIQEYVADVLVGKHGRRGVCRWLPPICSNWVME